MKKSSLIGALMLASTPSFANVETSLVPEPRPAGLVSSKDQEIIAKRSELESLVQECEDIVTSDIGISGVDMVKGYLSSSEPFFVFSPRYESILESHYGPQNSCVEMGVALEELGILNGDHQQSPYKD